METSTTLKMQNKIHVAKVEGVIGKSKDLEGQWASAWCGQTSSRVRPYYVADTTVTCRKCLSD
jgi:hypothetical protein